MAKGPSDTLETWCDRPQVTTVLEKHGFELTEAMFGGVYYVRRNEDGTVFAVARFYRNSTDSTDVRFKVYSDQATMTAVDNSQRSCVRAIDAWVKKVFLQAA